MVFGEYWCGFEFELGKCTLTRLSNNAVRSARKMAVVMDKQLRKKVHMCINKLKRNIAKLLTDLTRLQ